MWHGSHRELTDGEAVAAVLPMTGTFRIAGSGKTRRERTGEDIFERPSDAHFPR
jgi:hypothetical protein